MVEFLFLDFILLIVKVSYTKTANGKSQKVNVKVLKMDPKFSDRLYLVNNAPGK